MKLKIGYYLTRDGRVAIIEKCTQEPIWPFKGYILSVSTDPNNQLSWTDFGGYSTNHDFNPVPDPKLETEKDLVKYITRDSHPEYFL